MQQLTTNDFARLFGAERLPEAAESLIAAGDFGFEDLGTEARDELILSLLRSSDSADLSAAGPDRQGDWEQGWGENLAAFEASGDVADLVPRYFKPNLPVRLEGRFVETSDPDFYRHYTDVFRHWAFRHFFSDVERVFEFGCGSGNHVTFLAELFPAKEIVGLDWARASQAILDAVARVKGLKVEGRHFDFFQPDESLALGENAGVLTFGALEQVGDRFGAFLDYLLAQRPAICVHIEGFVELYRDDELFDYLATRYHRRRNYLEGLLPRLEELHAEGKIELLAVHRHRAGVFSNDTYSYAAWRPREARRA